MSGCGLLRDPTLFAALAEEGGVTTIRVERCVETKAVAKPVISISARTSCLNRLFRGAPPARVADTTCEFSCCFTPLSRSLCSLDTTLSSVYSLEPGHSDNGKDCTRTGDTEARSDDDGAEGDEVMWQTGVNIACEYLDLVAVHGTFPTQVCTAHPNNAF